MANKFEDALRAQRVRYDEVDEARTVWRRTLNDYVRERTPAAKKAHGEAAVVLDAKVAALSVARGELEEARTELKRMLIVQASA